MASEVTTVTIGDYNYTLYDDLTAQAKVTNLIKASYGALQESVTYMGVRYQLTNMSGCFEHCALTNAPEIPSSVTNMYGCFYDCRSLTTAPEIPSSVTNMHMCFHSCSALTTAPEIPSSVTDMYDCFNGCTSLITVPEIPSSVTNIYACFAGCTSLTGIIAVHGSPTLYYNCFYGTTQPIVLAVYDISEVSIWTQVAATGNNGNVTIRDVSANPAPTATITAVRVDDSGSYTPSENSRILLVTVRTSVSTELEPENVAKDPIVTVANYEYKDVESYIPGVWKAWYLLKDDFGREISATPRDLYKTGTTVTTQLTSTYSAMEFYEGGMGASFGKHAKHASVLDVAWDIHTDSEYTIADTRGTDLNGDPASVNIFDVMYPVGSIYMATEKDTDGNPRIAHFIPDSEWTRITGKFLLAATDGGSSGASQAKGNTGGEATHTLTTGETPLKSHHHGLNNHTHSMSHNHRVGIIRSNAEANGYGLTQTAGFQNRVIVQSSASGRFTSEGSSAANTGGSTANTTDTENTSATAHNNMPPFLAVYIWERTA